jgi:NADPH:quinone reductase-like Zn-dependent oxidoreductase
VIGTAGREAHQRVRELGGIPVDYRNEDVPARVRELAPAGVAAVFDHVGGPGIVESWRMLAPGGSLVSYGTASTRDAAGNSRLPVLRLVARLMVWNALPNRRRATFFNLWAGARKRDRYRAELRRDLGEVLRYAEQGGIVGKVVLEP